MKTKVVNMDCYDAQGIFVGEKIILRSREKNGRISWGFNPLADYPNGIKAYNDCLTFDGCLGIIDDMAYHACGIWTVKSIGESRLNDKSGFVYDGVKMTRVVLEKAI